MAIHCTVRQNKGSRTFERHMYVQHRRSLTCATLDADNFANGTNVNEHTCRAANASPTPAAIPTDTRMLLLPYLGCQADEICAKKREEQTTLDEKER